MKNNRQSFVDYLRFFGWKLISRLLKRSNRADKAKKYSAEYQREDEEEYQTQDNYWQWSTMLVGISGNKHLKLIEKQGYKH